MNFEDTFELLIIKGYSPKVAFTLAKEKIVNEKTFNDYPDSVVNNAKRGIELNAKVDNKCATQTGKIRGQQLANKESITLSTIKRMYSYLSRAETYYNPNDTKSCGTISFLLWGGLSAKNWSHNILIQEGEIEK